MKSNDELNDKKGLSTTPKGKVDVSMRIRTLKKGGGIQDPKLKKVPKAKYGVDEEGTEPRSEKLRELLTESGAIKKRKSGKKK